MKKLLCLLMCGFICLSLAACGDVLVDLNTPKSEELKSSYNYYENSVSKIRTNMDVTPEQADEIFIILVQCGLDGEITNIIDSKNSLYNVWYGSKSYNVTLNNGVVEKVMNNLDELYPTKKLRNYLMDSELKEIEIKNSDGNTVGVYAYISVSNKVLNEITDYHMKEFIENRVAKSNYDWVSIVATDKTGIQFTGASTNYGSYGKMDEKYRVSEVYGSVELQDDGTYKLPNFITK